jgi:hypothetical protein
MQAVIFGMLGISELHRRNASPEHICCASALKAKLWVDEIAEKEPAKASAKLILRTVEVKKAVIFGSHWTGSVEPVADGPHWAQCAAPTVTAITQAVRVQFSSPNGIVLVRR